MARITLVLRDVTYTRFVEGMMRGLAGHGHKLTLICPSDNVAGQPPTGERRPLLTDRRLSARWLSFARMLASYAHWLSGEYQWPDVIRDRWIRLMPGKFQALVRHIGRRRFDEIVRLATVRRALAGIERWVQPHSEIVWQLRDLNPDLLIASPAIFPYSVEMDYLKAARGLGIRTCVLVASWDNLTSKGIFHVVPDAVLVWNEAQVAEAVNIHGLPRERVFPVGAAVFDEWFTTEYLVPREAFCQSVGLDPARPYAVYAVSSSITGDESGIARRLAEELRARGDAQLLVRPHPKNGAGLERLNGAGLRVWPLAGVFPLTREQKRDYFNTLVHASAVVGLSTNVFVEAAILDRPCVSIAAQVAARAPFKHYEHLVRAGCIELVNDEAEAAQIVTSLLAGNDTKRKARRRFIEAFVRPAGLEQPAAPQAVAAIEELCQTPTRTAA